MAGSLDHDSLVELLDELARALERKRVRGHIYVVGGAAMTLSFSRERSTHDVDARIEHGHGAVTDAAREIGRTHGLGDSWLNEQATFYMPQAKDHRARTVYDSPFLVVTGASPEHMLAMKLESGREADADDVAQLVQTLQITTPEQGLAIHANLFPESNRRERAEGLLHTAIRSEARAATTDRGTPPQRGGHQEDKRPQRRRRRWNEEQER